MKVVMLLTGDSTVDTSNLDIKLVKDLEKIKNDKWLATFSTKPRNESSSLNIDDDNKNNNYNNYDKNQEKRPLQPLCDSSPTNCGGASNEESEKFLDRCKNSNKMFHIEEIYNSEHKQNALDLISKIVWYRKNYFKSLISILPILDDFQEQNRYGFIANNLVSFVTFQNQAVFKLKKELNNQMNLWIATTSTKSRNDVSAQTASSNMDNEKIKSKLDEFIANIDINDFLGEKFDFLFGRWLDSDNDLKEPLSKFYRDIYKQINEPHLYELLDN